MLIENDKRDTELDLLYADEKFSVPRNVYIIGMMNTADLVWLFLIMLCDTFWLFMI